MGSSRCDPWTRFMPKVDLDPVTGCWRWLAALNHEGYARFWSEGQKGVFAYRWAWIQRNGPVPEGMQLDHVCRTRSCVNPDHLEVVTARENLMRGQTAAAANAAKTYCDNGHEFTALNTYIHPQRGSRDCRACRRSATRRYDMKKVS